LAVPIYRALKSKAISTLAFNIAVIPVELLRKFNIQICMTQPGGFYDNAIAEGINGILKTNFEMYAIIHLIRQLLILLSTERSI